MQMYVNCSIFYILYILSTVYICDFMHMYFVRNDEIKMLINHFKAISEFELALQSGNAQFGSN